MDVAESADDEDGRRQRSRQKAKNISQSAGRDVAFKGYRYECQMADDPSFGLATHVKTGYQTVIIWRQSDKSAPATPTANGEWQHWKWLDSEHCLYLYERFKTDHGYYFVTDPVACGNVRTAIDNLPPPPSTADADQKIVVNFARAAAYNLLLALRDVHAAGFLHLNVGWSHVWIDAYDRLYLGGFEHLVPMAKGKSSSSVSSCSLASTRGDYPSPELLEGRTVTDRADVWSVGVAVFELFARSWSTPPKLLMMSAAAAIGCPRPTSAKYVRDIREYLPKLKSRLRDHCVDSKATDFLVRMLRYEPSKRPTAVEALQHAWFRGLGNGGSDGSEHSEQTRPTARPKVFGAALSISFAMLPCDDRQQPAAPASSAAAASKPCRCGLCSTERQRGNKNNQRETKENDVCEPTEKPTDNTDRYAIDFSEAQDMDQPTTYGHDSEFVEWPTRPPKDASSTSIVSSSSATADTKQPESNVPEECRVSSAGAVRAILQSRHKQKPMKQKQDDTASEPICDSDTKPSTSSPSTSTSTSSSSSEPSASASVSACPSSSSSQNALCTCSTPNETITETSSEDAEKKSKGSSERCDRRHPRDDFRLVKCRRCHKVIHPC